MIPSSGSSSMRRSLRCASSMTIAIGASKIRAPELMIAACLLSGTAFQCKRKDLDLMSRAQAARTSRHECTLMDRREINLNATKVSRISWAPSSLDALLLTRAVYLGPRYRPFPTQLASENATCTSRNGSLSKASQRNIAYCIHDQASNTHALCCIYGTMTGCSRGRLIS